MLEFIPLKNHSNDGWGKGWIHTGVTFSPFPPGDVLHTPSRTNRPSSGLGSRRFSRGQTIASFQTSKKKKTELFCANGVPCKKWSDEECKNLCKDLRKVLKDVRRQKETKYNALMRRKKRQYIMAKVHDDVMHS